MTRFLDTPESLPVRFTIPHYHLFNSSVKATSFKDQKLDSPESWDMLRETEPLFSVPRTREEWVRVTEDGIRKDGQDARLKERAHFIAEFIREKGIKTLFSVGSGGAGLEYFIAQEIPELSIICSEYAPKTVEVLKSVFTEARCIQFDIRHDSWSSVVSADAASTALCLLYRLDAQFTNAQWNDIFCRMKKDGVQHILYIPTGFLTLRSLLSRLRQRAIWRLSGKTAVFSGYLRTKKTFLSYWRRDFTCKERVIAGMTGFILSSK